jgi:hypothetical protein
MFYCFECIDKCPFGPRFANFLPTWLQVLDDSRSVPFRLKRINQFCSGSCSPEASMATKHLPIRCFCSVNVATLGQISPETATVLQLLLSGFVAFYRILPIMQRHALKSSRRRTQRSVAYHACRYRPRSWKHFYRSAWPVRLRLQSNGCVYCSLWLRTRQSIYQTRSVPNATLFQRVICWLSGGLGYAFDRTRGHPGEGPQQRDKENVWMKMRRVCVRVCVCV